MKIFLTLLALLVLSKAAYAKTIMNDEMTKCDAEDNRCLARQEPYVIKDKEVDAKQKVKKVNKTQKTDSEATSRSNNSSSNINANSNTNNGTTITPNTPIAEGGR